MPAPAALGSGPVALSFPVAVAGLVESPWSIGAAIVVLVLLVLVVVAAARGSADFEIRRRRGGRVEVRGRIPASKVGAIRAFFGRDLGAPSAMAVRGTFGPGRTLRLRFSGDLSPHQRQRARNFLVEHLR